MPNPCKTCSHAHNGINGRYCNMFKKYVEYMQSSICINKK
nr:MAG TPA: hypothetical protein [Caudoviricetes sp.]